MANLSLVSILLVFFLFTAGTTMHVEAKDDESIREHCTEIDNCIEECYTFCRPGIDSISSNCTVLGSLTEPGICCCKLLQQANRMNMDDGEGDHVSIDMEKLTDSLGGKLETLHPLSEECCIYERI
ncbi:hypothetical protein CUMW_102980 [Citrus unshiu]|uniref:Bifunctional inhibitor/plant lipid transfer protein/seed storage helical domain-containing protein n=1 Tax=Citrus sinensis TaxID=2711 RepID=A0A067FN18_CITSI|nr:hypothetical protein CISIN_1g033209mg [Citrus sinensis]GAY47226.1 hypothetical protein CUMW_102980 [Citrus unshiu]